MTISNTRRSFLSWLGAGAAVPVLAACGGSPAQAKSWPKGLSDAQWKAKLTKNQYWILREAGTERPFSSPLDKEHRKGTFVCAGCANELYSSATKYDSETGWPSFWRPLPDRDRDRDRLQDRRPPHRSAVRRLWGASGPRVQRRAAADRQALLHERRRDEVPRGLDAPSAARAPGTKKAAKPKPRRPFVSLCSVVVA